MVYLLLLIGFILLIKGADFFVDGSSSLAGILKVPSVIIGLTIVAMGTSAPEAAVSITAGLSGNNALSLGNIIGSNIFNLLMVIGISSLIFPIISHPDILHRDLWWNIGAAVLLFICLLDGSLGRLDGVILLVVFVGYMIILVRHALSHPADIGEQKLMSVPKSGLFILLGLIAIIAGGKLVVYGASAIAISLGMSETLIGLTIVAIGTSLPELVTSIVAARKGDSGIALGNAVGSCLFNILFILGASSLMTPLISSSELLIDTRILIGVSILLTIVAHSDKKTTRLEGLICILCYIIYTGYIIMR